MLPLTEADQQTLLRIARRALDEQIRKIAAARPDDVPRSLDRPGGAFVTLHLWGELRGCIGRVETSAPVYQTVYECAVSAALHDPRFQPATAEEVPALSIEISTLSPLDDAAPKDIQVGVHGIMVSLGTKRGLLLPQVATERNWDPMRFLEQTCIKAGLAADAWQCGARIQVFTAQVFSEERGGVYGNTG